MKKFYGYIRVSTVKQGVQGVSLPEQRDAILRHADRKDITITEWFEERETAAKTGRPVFDRMVKLLKAGKAEGVVIHKIDRSARNLSDWASLTSLLDLADFGVDVQSAADDLDLKTRSGRMTADMLAVIAADYIRNLKEEVRKGIDGRLKQGFYPLQAPLGYLDKGPGKRKELDPVRAPLVRKLFELYSTGRYNLKVLLKEVTELGLRSRSGRTLSLNSVSRILNNPFHMGLLRLKNREMYPGNHKPLVTSTTFNRVQAILRGKTQSKIVVHPFLFRKMLKCSLCGYSLTGERQKGHVYYRCHQASCPMNTLREELVSRSMTVCLTSLTLNAAELHYYKQKADDLTSCWTTDAEAERKSIGLRLEQNRERMARLTDAFIDQTIEKEVFEERKADLLQTRVNLQERLLSVGVSSQSLPDRLVEFFELVEKAPLLYEMGFPEEKRDLLKLLTSNRLIGPNEVVVAPSAPFEYLAKSAGVTSGGPTRGRLRTKKCDSTLTKIVDWIRANPESETFATIHQLLLVCKERADLPHSEAA